MNNVEASKHSIISRIWMRLRAFCAGVVIICGIVVGFFTVLLANDDLYKAHLTEFLTKQLNKEVAIDQISGRWNGLGPRFTIQGMTIKDDEEIAIGQATLTLNLIEYLIPNGATGIYLGISTIEIDVELQNSGELVFTEGGKNQESLSDKVESLLATGTLSVKDLKLNIFDVLHDKTSTINSQILAKKIGNKSAFAMELDSKGVAENIIIKVIADEHYDILKQAQWYLQVQDLSLNDLGQLIQKKFLPDAIVDAQMWVSTAKGNINSMLAKAELKTSEDTNQRGITGQAELLYRGTNRNWKAVLTIKNIKTEFISQDEIIVDLYRQDNIIGISADVLDIPLLKSIAQVLNIADSDFEQLVINGKLTDVDIKYDVDLRRVIDGSVGFDQLDFSMDFGVFSQLSGHVSLDDEQIRLLIDSNDGSATLPDIIRGTIKWNKLLLTLQTSMQDDDLDVKIKSLWCDCQDFIIDGAARFNYEETLFLDLTFAVHHAQTNQLYKYWPSITWGPSVLNFLDQALMSGEVEKGMILYHGFVNQAPFKGNQGIFITRSKMRDAQIKYHEDWPVLKGFDATVETINNTLTVDSQKGRVLDANIKDVFAIIRDFKSPSVEVIVDAVGQDNYLLDFLEQSPMSKGLDILNQEIILSGLHNTHVVLDIPLENKDAKVEPEGWIQFLETDFTMGQFDLQNLKGKLGFKGFSLKFNDLSSQFLQRDVAVTGQILNTPRQETSIDVLLQGRYAIEDFERSLGFALPANGESLWSFSINNPGDEPLKFSAKSDLVGIALDTPEPLLKPVDKISPFFITCELPCTDTGWYVAFDDKLESYFTMDLQTNVFELNKLNFGNFEEDFGGEIDVLDVDKWITLLTSNSGGESYGKSTSLPFDNMSMHVNELIFMSRTLLDVDITVSKIPEGMNFAIQGEEIAGNIMLADDIDKKGIIVQLQKLHWKKVDEVSEVESATSVSSKYPALHIRIDDFIYDGIPLGESVIEVRPVNNGIRVEKFATVSDLLSLNINGEWTRDFGTNGLSKFDIIMTSKDLATFLQNLGFEAPISQANTIIDLQAQWPDFPSQFEISSIDGQMRIEIGRGEVVDAKPGVGRVLGLFSLTNLPRRLILDFRDVFSKGLRFERMEGDFILENGKAYTDSFVIDSSSAKIIVTGQTGLADQDYNQTVTVTPRVGRVLPTIGAITGGAVGAAAGLFVQGLFRKDLKKLGKIVYKVTGSWDDPVINLIEAEEL